MKRSRAKSVFEGCFWILAAVGCADFVIQQLTGENIQLVRGALSIFFDPATP